VPTALRGKKGIWTQRWKQIVAQERSADWATHAAKAALRDPLRALTHGKCAFCEGTLDRTSYLQVEHYVSRRVDPSRAFVWKNLFPVCQICNTSKGRFDHDGNLLKPDVEDPEPYFWIGPEGDIEPHPDLDPPSQRRASETIRLCALNRGPLRENRYSITRALARWLHRASDSDNDLQQVQQEWDELSAPEREHKLVIRHMLTLHKHSELAVADRRRFQRGR
jgi:uncharacterized protein (TIGR02646 family)